ncbi:MULTISPECIES: hypothetical protein, partial [Comamonas]|uniref:hypothetical protein n=1 Tax=Comamonas TaxID=283 RepID=UPI00237EE225
MTAEDWKAMWGYFVRLLRQADIDFQYVAVLERHPSNLSICICMWLGVERGLLTTTCCGAFGIWPSGSTEDSRYRAC